MTYMIDALKRWPVGRVLVLAVATSVLVATTPRRANADLIEYTLLLAFVALASAALVPVESQPTEGASKVLIDELQASVEGAANASSNGDVPAQINGLSKAAAIARALEGTTSTCEDCGELRSILENIITGATAIKMELLGHSGTTCNPSSLVC